VFATNEARYGFTREIGVEAYLRASGLRRLGLKTTALAEAQVSTIRTEVAPDRRADSGDGAEGLDFHSFE